jgi:hypothetical protein
MTTASVKVNFNVYVTTTAALEIAFRVGHSRQSNERLLPGQPWLSHQVGHPMIANEPWISPFDGIIKGVEDPTNPTQGGNA